MTEPLIRFELPLDASPPQNRTRGAEAWKLGKIKERVWVLMLGQYLRAFRHAPLTASSGLFKTQKPLPADFPKRRIVCTRYSSVEPDRWSDWAKIPIDLLCVPRGRRKRGLSLIWDDAPKYADVDQRWERARPGQGKVVIEVFAEGE